jgi:flagellar FliL protein
LLFHKWHDGDNKAGEGVRPGMSRGIALTAAVIVLASLAVWWKVRPSEPAAAAADQTGVKFTLHLESFVLNLADADQRSYLRVGIDLGLGREPGKDNSAPVALVRDTILGVLAQAKVGELLTAKGKENLKAELLRALQQRVPELEVREVYFTEFLVQR